MNTLTIPASQVREGDFLPGLDNGYVYADPSTDVPGTTDGRFYFTRGEGFLSIGFHTAQGEEAELIVPADMPVTVQR
jgi:hypothetical protein